MLHFQSYGYCYKANRVVIGIDHVNVGFGRSVEAIRMVDGYKTYNHSIPCERIETIVGNNEYDMQIDISIICVDIEDIARYRRKGAIDRYSKRMDIYDALDILTNRNCTAFYRAKNIRINANGAEKHFQNCVELLNMTIEFNVDNSNNVKCQFKRGWD